MPCSYLHMKLKVLQDAFEKVGITKRVDVERLIKGKYQDNLEFLQWIKRYYDVHAPGEAYDAVAKREASRKAGAASATSTTRSAPSVPSRPAVTAKFANAARRKAAAAGAVAALDGNASSSGGVTTTTNKVAPIRPALAARRNSPVASTSTRSNLFYCC